jgi:hypothetical protein
MIEGQLFDAIDDSGYRALIKNGNIYMADSNGFPGELILVDPAEAEDLDDPTVLNLAKDRRDGIKQQRARPAPREVLASQGAGMSLEG